MGDDESRSSVEITIGHNNLRIEGSEGFISQQLTTILDRVDLGAQAQEQEVEAKEDSKQATLGDVSEEGTSVPEKSETEPLVNMDPRLAKIADRINVEPEALADHFYLDGDDVHIQDPMNIEPKYALLGYCTIKEEMTGEPYHGNNETKQKLIDIEKVDIDKWGRTFLHNLRQGGYIKDDPNSSKDRNRPFKITPHGRAELVEWLNEDD